MAHAWCAGPLEVRRDDLIVLADGRPLLLSPQQFAVLAALMAKAGDVVTREEIHRQVWRTPWRPANRSVDAYVHQIRRRLGAALPDWTLIHTQRGVGYRLAPVPRTARCSCSSRHSAS